jgi:hypothetical protein
LSLSSEKPVSSPCFQMQLVPLHCGSRILCAERNQFTDLVLDYGEPEPEAVGSLIEGCIDAGIAINKVRASADRQTSVNTRPFFLRAYLILLCPPLYLVSLTSSSISKA